MLDISLIKKAVLRGELTFFIAPQEVQDNTQTNTRTTNTPSTLNTPKSAKRNIFCRDNYTQEILSMEPEVGSQAYIFDKLRSEAKQTSKNN